VAALETARGGQATITAPALAFTFAPSGRRGAPSRLARVATLGRGMAVWQAPGAAQDLITADRLALRLNADQHPQAAAAEGRVLLAAGARPGSPSRQVQASHLVASFAADGGLRQARAAGSVVLRQGDERALADRADFDPARNSVLLQARPDSAFTHGKVSAASPELTLSAPSVREQGGRVVAEGGVTASLLPRAAQGHSGAGSAAPFGGAGGQPIDIAAQRAALAPKGAAGDFSGAVRLWQGANVMWADRVTFARDAPRFSAVGDVRSTFLAPRGLPEERGGSLAALAGSGHAGRTRPAAPARPMPVMAVADRLDYVGATRQAVYSGHVKVTAGDSILTAQKLRIEFLPAGAPAAPARVRRVVAEGGAQLLEPGRRAAAEQIVYDFAAGLVTLSGGSPSIFDAELGYLAGSTLTFSPSNASIRVESGGGSRTYGEYRIKK
ncbi:MAG: LptA/OstA family protein, partial [Terriglobales bacterium]